MDAFDTLVVQLTKLERGPRIALACQCATRAKPIYDAFGDSDPAYADAVELAWRGAETDASDPAAFRLVVAGLHALLDFYGEDGYDLMAHVVTVALRAVQALDQDASASALAVARALYSARALAASAEAQVQPPGTRLRDEADAEERTWQQAALRIAEAWHGPVTRDMFDTVPAPGASWLEALLAGRS
jgi:hypothetical protein